MEYTLDIPLFNRYLRDLLAEVEHTDVDYDAEILADRITSRLSPTRQGVVTIGKEDADRRVQQVFREVANADARAGVAHATLVLMASLSG
jgi:hypothetical protein